MDVGGALGVLAEDRVLTAKCPLADLARALRDTDAHNSRDAAAAVLKRAQAEHDDATLQAEQCEIARHKLRAELARVESLTAEAEAAKAKTAMTVALCRSLLAANFEDRAPSASSRSGAMAPAGGHAQQVSQPGHPTADESGQAATRDAAAPAGPDSIEQRANSAASAEPGALSPRAERQPGPPGAHHDAQEDAALPTPVSPLDGVVTALTAEVTVREERMLPLLEDLENDVRQRIDNPWSTDTYGDWVYATELLWSYALTPRPPAQLIVLMILQSLLRRAVHPPPPGPDGALDAVSLRAGAAEKLQKLAQSVNDDVKAEALELITLLGTDDSCRGALTQVGLVPVVCKLVETSNSEIVLERSLSAVWAFSGSDEGRSEVLRADGIQAMLSLLFTDSLAILDNVAMALGLLTRDPRVKAAMAGIRGMEKLAACLLHPSPNIRKKIAGAIWNCGAEPENRAELIRIGAVPLLSELLSDEAAQVNAAGALWNLALEEPGKRAILEYGGLHALITLLSSPNDEVVENASGTLWNCAANVENRASMRKLGALPLLVSHMNNAKPEIRENAAGAMRNMVINDQCKVAFREAGGIELIVDNMAGASNTLLEKWMSALWIISVTPENKHALRLAGGLPKLVALLDDRDATVVVREKALGTLRNCSMAPENVKPLVEAGVLTATLRATRAFGALARPAPHCNPQVRENLAFLLMNTGRVDKVASGRAQVLHFLVDMLDDPQAATAVGEAKESVRENVTGALAALVSSTPENRDILHELGAVPKLVGVLAEARSTDSPHLVHSCLLAIKHSTTMHDNNLLTLLAQQGIVQSLVDLVRAPPGAGQAFHAEDIAREAVFCLRNVCASPQGATEVRKAGGDSILQHVHEKAQSEALRIACSVVLQMMSKRR